MEGAGSTGPSTCRPRPWLDLGLLLILLVAAASIHAWLMRHTVVPSRDGIGFMTYAWQLEHQPWTQVLRQNAQHPLYPLAIAAASWPVSHFATGLPTDVMLLSAQLVCTGCGVFLVVPMYFLGKLLFRRSVGFWASLLFQCFPVSARATADSLSEGLFLLLIATALLTAALALRRGSWRLCASCGVLSGLAYLTRPEGAVIAAAAGLVLLGWQRVPAWRRPWRPVLTSMLGLCAGLVLVAAPYVAVTGRLTGKQTALESLGLAVLTPSTYAANEVHVTRHPLAFSTLAVFLEWGSQHRPPGFRGFCLGLWCLATEIDRGFHHVAWVFVPLGLWWFRGRSGTGASVLLVVCFLQAVAMCGLVFVVGYLADRHVLVLCLCGLFWAVAAVQELPARLGRMWNRRWLSAPGWSVLVLLALAASGLPKTLKPLHPQRAGHRAAGQWLAEHVHQGDMVEDPYYWAQFYSGWDFGLAPPRPPNDSSWNHYIVVERSANPHLRLSLIKEEIVKRGTPVFCCPLRTDKHGADEVQILTINFTRTAVKPPPMRNIP